MKEFLCEVCNNDLWYIMNDKPLKLGRPLCLNTNVGNNKDRCIQKVRDVLKNRLKEKSGEKNG